MTIAAHALLLLSVYGSVLSSKVCPDGAIEYNQVSLAPATDCPIQDKAANVTFCRTGAVDIDDCSDVCLAQNTTLTVDGDFEVIDRSLLNLTWPLHADRITLLNSSLSIGRLDEQSGTTYSDVTLVNSNFTAVDGAWVYRFVRMYLVHSDVKVNGAFDVIDLKLSNSVYAADYQLFANTVTLSDSEVLGQALFIEANLIMTNSRIVHNPLSPGSAAYIEPLSPYWPTLRMDESQIYLESSTIPEPSPYGTYFYFFNANMIKSKITVREQSLVDTLKTVSLVSSVIEFGAYTEVGGWGSAIFPAYLNLNMVGSTLLLGERNTVYNAVRGTEFTVNLNNTTLQTGDACEIVVAGSGELNITGPGTLRMFRRSVLNILPGTSCTVTGEVHLEDRRIYVWDQHYSDESVVCMPAAGKL